MIKKIKSLFKKENFLPLAIVVFFAVLAGHSLIFERGYFKMHDDLQMMRQLEMEKCFKDFQIPCRWVPDMGYGYGFPLFNFYPPLPYFVGQIFRIFQISFVDTAKLTFALSFILSGITMYLFAKEFFGKWGGTLSAIFYIWAPYHSTDIYVRGAMNEAWALVWFPAIFWTSYRLIKERKKDYIWVIGLSLSWAGLLLSHNLMVMIFTPLFAFWCLIFWVKEKDWKKFWQLVFSGLIALGVSAFFTLPAILEQKYIHVDTLTKGYYEYIAHFATINQILISRFWGYGPSIWGEGDGMSFQIGHIHWILSILIGVFTIWLFLNRKKFKIDSYTLYTILFLFLTGWFALFMTHVRSTFIWQHIPPLAFVQFPWRFLAISTFTFSFISGSVVLFMRSLGKLSVIISTFLVVFLVIINWNYFLPDGGKMGPLTDEQKFSGAAWDLQRTAGIFDYLPESAKENPKDPPKVLAEVINGTAGIASPDEGTSWAKFKINVSSGQALVRVNIYKFPNWESNVDGDKVNNFVPDSEMWGRMYIKIPKGDHAVSFKLENTPLRSVSNVISIFTILSLLTFPLWRLKVIQFRRGQ